MIFLGLMKGEEKKYQNGIFLQKGSTISMEKNTLKFMEMKKL